LIENVKIKHSFNAGDLISIMAGLRQLYCNTGRKIEIYQRLNLPAFYYEGQVNSTFDGKGVSVCMNEQMFYMLKPLMESQEYVSSFNIWKGEKVDLDYDLCRDSRAVPMPNGLLHVWSEALFPETTANLSISWLRVEEYSIKKDFYKDKIIINRSHRYQNPYITYFFLKEHQDRIIFSGTDSEHEDFCTKFDLQIGKLHVDNFYQLAQIISWCKFGIYNQSMNFHLANAMHTPRILELCGAFPNTFNYGANGRHFYHQSALQYHYHQLLNK
jgi:hypothetical protein